MKRSKISLSHNHNTTFDMGQLIPIAWYDLMPGDTIQAQTAMLVRTQPLLTPLMHPCYIHINHWFVPYRLIWEDWEDFITGGEDGLDASVHPYIQTTGPSTGDLLDYLGLPTVAYGRTVDVNALPVRAYQLIRNESFRDQDLQTKAALSKASGADATTSTSLQYVNWAKDYFTSARPSPQKGTQVTIPLGDKAPLAGLQYQNVAETGTMSDVWDDSATGVSAANSRGVSVSVLASAPKAYADLQAATGIDLMDLRLATSIQAFQEARQRYGSRYVEYLRYLGIKRPLDQRLQRPEFLGGGKQSISFSEVISTADSGTDVVGTLRGRGISAVKSNRFRRFIEEHGLMMTLAYVRPKALYSQGIDKKWTKTVKEEYFNKELQYIGDQEVLNQELYVTHASPTDVFGYQNRYDEYRFEKSKFSGNMEETTYNTWHMGRVFSSDPALNSSFITCNPTKRVFANTSDHSLIVAAHNSVVARRPISKQPLYRTF